MDKTTPMHPPEPSQASNAPSEEVRLAGRLGELSLPRQIAVLAVWPLLEQILAFLVGLTDLLIAGRMAAGAERVAILDAMGLGGYVAWFFNILQGAVATGVMALVSRATGARDHPLACRGLGQGLWLGILAGLASWAMLTAGAPLLIRWVGLSPAAALEASHYLEVLAWSGPLSGALFAVNAALRGAGDTKTPFLSMLVVNLFNAGFSVLLVFAPTPFGGHGIRGIAAGTVIGWAVGLATVLTLVGFRKSSPLRWSIEALRPHPQTLWRISRIGLPQMLEIAGMWLIHSFGIRVIAGLPVAGALGAHILAIRVESMSFLPGFAVATAASALVGQYLGAGSPRQAVRAVRLCWALAVGMMSLAGIGFVLGRQGLIEWMAPGSTAHVTLAVPLLVVCAISQPFFATCIILKSTMRGAGATPLVMRWSFGCMVFFRVLLLGWLNHHHPITLTSVWIVFATDLLVQAAIFARLHFKGQWLRARV